MRLVRTALVLSLWALAACAQSPPPGEIDIYKVQVQESFVRTDRTSNTYVLRGRGFALSENFGRIEDAFGSHTHVGPLRLLEVIEQLRTETRTAWTRMKAEGNDASPAARRLLEIDAELEAVAAGVERRITSAILPEPRTLVLTPRARREPKFEEAVKLLRNIERYLEHLRESARSAVRNRRSAVGGLHKQRGFDIIFEIGGRPLVPGDWTRPAPHLPVVLDSGKYEALFDHIPRTFQDMFDYVNGLVPPSPTLLVQAEEPTLKDLDQLEVLLKRITESSLNMSHALLNREGTVHTWKEESERKRRRSAADAFEASYEQTLDYLRIDIEKARVLIRRILERLSPPIVQICSNFAAEKVKVEGMAREFAILTHRDHNRPLRRAEKPGEPPVYLTITLKHLFLKHVGNGGANTPILVTCGIKTAANAEEAVYPIIFERNFTPDNPVNRKDRIAYGPYPYRGEFMDFRFTVLHLRSLDSEALINGFANLNAVAGAFNPQLAVLSPIVTALFGAIVRHATEDLVELDASFTFPGQHRPDKPDVDMLVTETGHYVILKNENPVRFRTPPPTDPRRPVPPAADPEPDDRQMMYRWLIFNPENNILYWRRHFTNPRDNFQPEYEFREQSYAVLTVTDEYPAQDDLGTILRRQVAQALGEARSRELIPDFRESAELLRQFRDLRREERQVKRVQNEPERAALEADLKRRKDELWSDLTALQKQVIVEALYDTSDPATKGALGTDLEKWKRADIVVGLDGLVRRRVVEPEMAALRAVPGGPAFQAFAEREPELPWTFEVVQPDPGAALGTIDVKGVYTPPAVPSAATVRVRAKAVDVQNVPRVLERTIRFAGEHRMRIKVAGGAAVRQTDPGQPLVEEVVLDRPTRTLRIDLAKIKHGQEEGEAKFRWRLGTEWLPVDPARLPKGVTRLELKEDNHRALEIDVAGKSLVDASTSFFLVAVPEAFHRIVETGGAEGIPVAVIQIGLKNPLAFSPTRLMIDWRQKEPGFPKVMLALQGGLAEEAKAEAVQWTAVIDGQDEARKSFTARPGDAIPFEKSWFSPDRLEGRLVIEGTLPLKTGNVQVGLKRALPYRIEK